MKINNARSGQILLLIILLSTALLTVGLSISQISTQETQIAKLEEQSKIAFSAAEAGVEAALQLEPGESVNFSDLGFGADISGQAEVITESAPEFATPLLRKDEMYTFYLAAYNTETNQIGDPANSDSFTVSLVDPDIQTFCNSDDTKLAVELTFINKDTNRIVARRLIDDCDVIENHPSEGEVDEVDFGETIGLVSFPSHLIFIRLLAPHEDFAGAKLQINNTANSSWPAQGKTVVSQATTTTEVAKKIKLFQTFPQLPEDFIVTSL